MKPMEELKPHELRVHQEKLELDVKLAKLRMFIAGETYNSLSLAERKRLMRQAAHMAAYSDVLMERIEAF